MFMQIYQNNSHAHWVHAACCHNHTFVLRNTTRPAMAAVHTLQTYWNCNIVLPEIFTIMSY